VTDVQDGGRVSLEFFWRTRGPAFHPAAAMRNLPNDAPPPEIGSVSFSIDANLPISAGRLHDRELFDLRSGSPAGGADGWPNRSIGSQRADGYPSMVVARSSARR
jgi:hypothetical protein